MNLLIYLILIKKLYNCFILDNFKKLFLINNMIILYINNSIIGNGDWGLGIGVLGFGGLGRTPNTKTQKPKTTTTKKIKKKKIILQKKFKKRKNS